MSKKKIFLLSVAAILVVVLVMLILSSFSWFYTEDRHIHRIRERAEKRFFGGRQRVYGLRSISGL